MNTSEEQVTQIPIKNGLLTSPLTPLEQVRLVGSKCVHCGEVAFGTVSSCPNCVGTDLNTIKLSETGVLWTYTVIRNRPPGDYRGPDPFVPFAEGLVEMPEGIRVLSPVACEIEKLAIGMKLKFEAYKLYQNADGADVIAFRFVADQKGAK
jgi:uncharacterized OB-fold protein